MDTQQEYSILQRFSEPSSYAALATAFGVTATQVGGWFQAVVMIGCGACALAAFFMKEKGLVK